LPSSFTSITYRVWRSTNVAIWLLRLPPDETRRQQHQLRNVERLGQMRLIAREQ
jgi:hypothetical protein